MIPPLCFITDAGAPRPVAEQALAAARGGAGWIQIRDKTRSDAEIAALAQSLLGPLHALGARLIINDRVEVAIATRADGLHIGQGDGDPARIRTRIGARMILGLSIDTQDQLAHVPDGVDYLGIGPIRATASKPDHATPIGIDGFRRIVAATALPCLAIGGLTAQDATAIRTAGGAGLAIVSAIAHAADPEQASRTILDAWQPS